MVRVTLLYRRFIIDWKLLELDEILKTFEIC